MCAKQRAVVVGDKKIQVNYQLHLILKQDVISLMENGDVFTPAAIGLNGLK